MSAHVRPVPNFIVPVYKYSSSVFRNTSSCRINGLLILFCLSVLNIRPTFREASEQLITDSYNCSPARKSLVFLKGFIVSNNPYSQCTINTNLSIKNYMCVITWLNSASWGRVKHILYSRNREAPLVN